MSYQYHIKLNRVHGIDVYTCILVQGRSLVASSTPMSKELATTWAIVTHRKIISNKKAV